MFQELTETLTPQEFLAAMGETEYRGIVFTDNTAQLQQNAQFLASTATLSAEEIAAWEEAGFLVVAQTMDGDFIGADTERTRVIPSSLYQSDIEVYELPIVPFFQQIDQGTLHSNYIPES